MEPDWSLYMRCRCLLPSLVCARWEPGSWLGLSICCLGVSHRSMQEVAVMGSGQFGLTSEGVWWGVSSALGGPHWAPSGVSAAFFLRFPAGAFNVRFNVAGSQRLGLVWVTALETLGQ